MLVFLSRESQYFLHLLVIFFSKCKEASELGHDGRKESVSVPKLVDAPVVRCAVLRVRYLDGHQSAGVWGVVVVVRVSDCDEV